MPTPVWSLLYSTMVLYDCADVSDFLYTVAGDGNGVDFESATLTAVFHPGNTQVNISLNITKDAIFEPTEFLKLTLTVPDEFSNINGRLLVKTGDNDMANGEIINSGGV